VGKKGSVSLSSPSLTTVTETQSISAVVWLRFF
jgi:hypothetical protein